MRRTRNIAALALLVGLACATPAWAVTQEEADAAFAAQQWAAAADGYEDLLRTDRANANNWFNLARAQHQLGDLTAARRSYQRALDNNHAAPGRVRFNLARAQMSAGRRAEALRTIQQLVGTGITHRQLVAATEFAPLASEPDFQSVVAAQTPCNTPEYRQFDFWLGDWDIVSTGPGASAGGHNVITAIQDGCVVLENYDTPGGFTGMSMNFYDSTRQLWHQTWMSNSGGALYLEGRLNEAGAMVLSDENLPSHIQSGIINRTTWTPLAEGGLRQLWDSSSDQGATWTTIFDGRYVRRVTN